jgi:hypothetical protein
MPSHKEVRNGLRFGHGRWIFEILANADIWMFVVDSYLQRPKINLYDN